MLLKTLSIWRRARESLGSEYEYQLCSVTSNTHVVIRLETIMTSVQDFFIFWMVSLQYE